MYVGPWLPASTMPASAVASTPRDNGQLPVPAPLPMHGLQAPLSVCVLHIKQLAPLSIADHCQLLRISGTPPLPIHISHSLLVHTIIMIR